MPAQPLSPSSSFLLVSEVKHIAVKKNKSQRDMCLIVPWLDFQLLWDAWALCSSASFLSLVGLGVHLGLHASLYTDGFKVPLL